MDEQGTQSNNSMGKFIIPAAVVVIIVIAVIFFFTAGKKETTTPSTEVVSDSQNTSTNEETAGAYKNGTYSADGNYISPGGPRDIGVTITISNNVVTDAQFEGRATDPTSKRFQGEFAGGFKTQVVGKNIDEVNITKVAGSSLSPKGFMDALGKIKTEAKS